MPVNRIRQTRIAEPIDNHKQGGEKHQQMPINQLEHFMCVAARQHHDERCARKRSPRQVESSEEAPKDQNKNNADDSKQSVVELRDSVRRSFDHRFSQTPPKTETQNCEVDRQSDDRHWHECARELDSIYGSNGSIARVTKTAQKCPAANPAGEVKMSIKRPNVSL